MKKIIIKGACLLVLVCLFFIPEKAAALGQEIAASNQQEITFQIIEESTGGHFQLPSTNELLSGVLVFLGIFTLGLWLILVLNRRRRHAKKL
ncbi:LPXTG cell wall anchor domain-containing protein [Enterococcus sp. LJL90]